MRNLLFVPALLLLANCTTPAYLVRQTSEPKGGEIEMISPDGSSFSEESLKASTLMVQVCGEDLPQVLTTEYRNVPFYSALQENTSYQKRGYVTFACGTSVSANSAVAAEPAPSSGRAPASLPTVTPSGTTNAQPTN